jgi:hypothetical protein
MIFEGHHNTVWAAIWLTAWVEPGAADKTGLLSHVVDYASGGDPFHPIQIHFHNLKNLHWHWLFRLYRFPAFTLNASMNPCNQVGRTDPSPPFLCCGHQPVQRNRPVQEFQAAAGSCTGWHPHLPCGTARSPDRQGFRGRSCQLYGFDGFEGPDGYAPDAMRCSQSSAPSSPVHREPASAV